MITAAAGSGAGVEGPPSLIEGWGELAVESAGVGGINPGTAATAETSPLAGTSIVGFMMTVRAIRMNQ